MRKFITISASLLIESVMKLESRIRELPITVSGCVSKLVMAALELNETEFAALVKLSPAQIAERLRNTQACQPELAATGTGD